MHTTFKARPSLKTIACACTLGFALVSLPTAQAQVQIRDIDPPNASTTAPQAPATVDLGESVGKPARAIAPIPPSPIKKTTSATARAPDANAPKPAKTDLATRPPKPGTERAVFNRVPIRVALPIDRERLITLPGVAALHVPDDIEQFVKIQSIDRTVYVTALKEFPSIRIVAELLGDGSQIPMDLQANANSASASAELEVFMPSSAGATGNAANNDASGNAAQGSPEPAGADMVELTRYAARMLYAPKRLALPRDNIVQAPLTLRPVAGLLRGALVETVPLAQWRSGDLYVTAVRVTNKSTRPLEIVLEDLRGQWIAATAQHGRIGAAGSELDTTALYLICDRSFEACL